MITITTAMQSYLPPIWELFDDSDTDVPELIEGDLVEFDSWDCTRDENGNVLTGYEGCGIIKRFTTADFLNTETGKLEVRPCAIVVPPTANNWLDYVPMENIDPLALSRYLELYKDEYVNTTDAEMQNVRLSTLQRMSFYSGQFGTGAMPHLLPQTNAVQVEVAS